MENLRARCRTEQDAIEREIAARAPEMFMAVADDDPRRCPPGGLGKLHDVRRDPDGVWRCFNCRAEAA